MFWCLGWVGCQRQVYSTVRVSRCASERAQIALKRVWTFHPSTGMHLCALVSFPYFTGSRGAHDTAPTHPKNASLAHTSHAHCAHVANSVPTSNTGTRKKSWHNISTPNLHSCTLAKSCKCVTPERGTPKSLHNLSSRHLHQKIETVTNVGTVHACFQFW